MLPEDLPAVPFPCFAGNGQINGCITTGLFHPASELGGGDRYKDIVEFVKEKT